MLTLTQSVRVSINAASWTRCSTLLPSNCVPSSLKTCTSETIPNTAGCDTRAALTTYAGRRTPLTTNLTQLRELNHRISSASPGFAQLSLGLRASPHNRSYLRWYSSKTKTKDAWKRREVDVPVGGNGSVRLDICRLRGEHAATEGLWGEVAARPIRISNHLVVVYLPTGPLPGHNAQSSNIEFDLFLSKLAEQHSYESALGTAAVTVVRINYRLRAKVSNDDEEQDLRYPTPIHDVMTCFDWILEQQLAEVTRQSNKDIDPPLLTIHLVGHGIGGALALTTALTNPNEIESVVVIDPIVDWTGLDELVSHSPLLQIEDIASPTEDLTSKKRKTHIKSTSKSDVNIEAQAFAARALINLRSNLFRSPSGFFDQFASPLLFLRAPGKDTPLWRSARPEGEYNIKELDAFGPYDDDWDLMHRNSDHTSSPEPEEYDRQARVDDIVEAVGTDVLPQSKDSNQSLEDDGVVVLDHDEGYQSTIDAAGFVVDEPPSSGLYGFDNDLGRDPGSPDLYRHGPSPDRYIESPLLRPTEEVQEIKPVKRRKTLRRWPAVGRPEDVMLPHTCIFATAPSPDNDPDSGGKVKATDLSHVLYPQAREMVSVMRRACFWGTGQSLADERVVFETLNAESMRKEGEGDAEAAKGEVKSTRQETVDRVVEWLVKDKSNSSRQEDHSHSLSELLQ